MAIHYGEHLRTAVSGLCNCLHLKSLIQGDCLLFSSLFPKTEFRHVSNREEEIRWCLINTSM